MMGRQRRDQGRLFYEFRLEDRIPENHLLRRMNVFVTVALAVKRPRTVDRDRLGRVDHPLGCEVAAPSLEARSAA